MDVLHYQTNDNGEINIVNGVTELTPDFRTAVYHSLFGGNEEDDGVTVDNKLQYWGNALETENSKKYRSQTQYIIKSLPLTSGNLLKLESAARSDLQWFLDEKIANEISINITVPKLNTVNISVNINAYGEEQNFNFTENWGASV